MRQLLIWSVVTLAATGAGSLAIGWLVADRVLAPLRTMTAATRRISQDNLHERLALRRFVANASHKLRTPLARIRTALDVADGFA